MYLRIYMMIEKLTISMRTIIMFSTRIKQGINIIGMFITTRIGLSITIRYPVGLTLFGKRDQSLKRLLRKTKIKNLVFSSSPCFITFRLAAATDCCHCIFLMSLHYRALRQNKTRHQPVRKSLTSIEKKCIIIMVLHIRFFFRGNLK